MNKIRLIHLIQGESDTSGYVYSCCHKDVLIKFARDTKRGITCKDCLKEDRKHNTVFCKQCSQLRKRDIDSKYCIHNGKPNKMLK